MLHMTRVAKCGHNLHAVTLLHKGITDSIDKCHHVIVFPQRMTLQCRNLQKNNTILLLEAHGRTKLMLTDISGFAELELIGFGCFAT